VCPSSPTAEMPHIITRLTQAALSPSLTPRLAQVGSPSNPFFPCAFLWLHFWALSSSISTVFAPPGVRKTFSCFPPWMIGFFFRGSPPLTARTLPITRILSVCPFLFQGHFPFFLPPQNRGQSDLNLLLGSFFLNPPGKLCQVESLICFHSSLCNKPLFAGSPR